MTNQRYPLLRFLLVAIVVMSSFNLAMSQQNPDSKHFELITNTIFIDTIESQTGASSPTLIFPAGSTYQLISSTEIAMGSGLFEIKISFEPDFIGEENITVTYNVPYGPFNFTISKFIDYHFDIFPSIVHANDDFIESTGGTLNILPLENDDSNTESHELISINQVKYGSAYASGDTIVYDGSFEEDIILYSIQDSIGTTDQGIIYITKNDIGYNISDSINYLMLNNESKLLILPNDGFTILTAPTDGDLTQVGSQGYSYRPDPVFTGDDTIVFEDGVGITRTYFIKVEDAYEDPGYVRNDVFYTPKDEAITMDVHANDLISVGSMLDYSTDLTLVGPGLFEYTPATGFEGVVKFFYKKNFVFFQETGYITLSVGNYNPTKEIPYEFEVLNGNDFYIEYDVPLEGYSFNIVSNPTNGVAEAFTITDSYEGLCDSINNKIGLSYSPNAGYEGLDEFDIEYCINGTQCEFYKLRFSVISPTNTDCNCIENCVWQGDANGDGRVSVTDVLSIGRHMGDGGSSRTDVNQGIWIGEEASDWLSIQGNGKNVKHVDSNRDGVITEQDLTAIENNYGKLNSLVPEEILTVKDYPFTLIPNATEVDSGDVLILQIALGTEQFPAKDLHGLTFGFNINPNIIDSSSAELILYDNSWMSDQSPTVSMAVHKSEGKIDVGYSLTSGLGVSGHGIIGQLSFIVEEDVTGIKTNELIDLIRESVILRDGLMEDMFGTKFRLPDASASFDIRLNAPKDEMSEVVVYPNPANDLIKVYLNGEENLDEVKVFDMSGRLVKSLYPNDRKTWINSTEFQEGIHIIQCLTGKQIITKRVMIVK